MHPRLGRWRRRRAGRGCRIRVGGLWWGCRRRFGGGIGFRCGLVLPLFRLFSVCRISSFSDAFTALFALPSLRRTKTSVRRRKAGGEKREENWRDDWRLSSL